MSYRNRERRKQKRFEDRLHREVMRGLDEAVREVYGKYFTGYLWGHYTKPQPERPPLSLATMSNAMSAMSTLSMSLPIAQRYDQHRLEILDTSLGTVPDFLKGYTIGVDLADPDGSDFLRYYKRMFANHKFEPKPERED